MSGFVTLNWPLDLDDFRAEVCEKHRAEGPRKHMTHL
jgi:hypothetical protein